MDRRVKERLVGATILVVLIVLVVPELLSGPKAPAPPPLVVDRAEPLRNVTVDLATSKATTAAPGTAAPAAAPDLSSVPASSAAPDTVTADAGLPPGASSAADAGSLPGASAARDSSNVPGPSGARGSSNVPDTWGARDSATLAAGTSAGRDPSAPDATSARAAAPQDSPAAASSGSPASSAATGSPMAAVAQPDIKTVRAQRTATPALESAPAHPDTSARTVARAAAPAVGAGHRVWFVQLGSFASKVHADNLVRQLQAQGTRVYVTAGGSGASLRYRVRTGPLADRAAAERAVSKLKSKGHNASVVVPAP